MKRVLFDSDVIIDVMANRQPFIVNSAQALNTVATFQVEGYIAGHAVTNIFYILRRQLGVSVTLDILTKLLGKLKVASVTDAVIHSALQTKMTDFEDAVTSEAAFAINLDFIVTRNTKDYVNSSVSAIPPEKLLQLVSI